MVHDLSQFPWGQGSATGAPLLRLAHRESLGSILAPSPCQVEQLRSTGPRFRGFEQYFEAAFSYIYSIMWNICILDMLVGYRVENREQK